MSASISEAQHETHQAIERLLNLENKTMSHNDIIDAYRHREENYAQAERDYFDATELEELSKENLDKEIMEIFGVDSMDKLNPQWIRVALSGGNLQNDTEWETEEEFEFLINASNRLTEEKAQNLQNLIKNESKALKGVKISVKDMHAKQAVAERLETSQDLEFYMDKVKQLGEMQGYLRRELARRESILKSTDTDRLLRDLQGEYQTFMEIMTQNLQDIQNIDISATTIGIVAQHMLGNAHVQEGDISAKTVSDVYQASSLSKLQQIDISEDNQKAIQKGEEFINLLDLGIDESAVCDNAELENNTAKSLEKMATYEDKEKDKIVSNIEENINQVNIMMNEISEVSMTNMLGDGSKLINSILYYMEELKNEMDLNNPNPCSREELEEKFTSLQRMLGKLNRNTNEIEDQYEQKVYQARQNVGKYMEQKLQSRAQDVGKYAYSANEWLVDRIDKMNGLADYRTPEQEEAFQQYATSQLTQLKNISQGVETRTDKSIPQQFKERYNLVLLNIKSKHKENVV